MLCVNLPAQEKPTGKERTEKTTPIVGRVLADIESLGFGSALGPKYTSFIFGIEKSGGVITPVVIGYAFLRSQGPPPDSFFDHSKLYELQALRVPVCDATVSSLFQIKNEDETGKPLPPTDALRMLDGAPRDILKLKPEFVLPCYIVGAGEYRILSQSEGRGAPGAKM